MMAHEMIDNMQAILDSEAGIPTDEEFKDYLIRAMGLLRMSSYDVSVRFEVSRPSVERWMRGVTSPARLMKKFIFKKFIEDLNELRQLGQGSTYRFVKRA